MIKREAEKWKKRFDDFLESESTAATAGKFLLVALAASGIFFVGAAMPGVLRGIDSLKSSKRYSKKQLQNAYYNLKKNKLIEIIDEIGGKSKVRLTLKGETRIKEFCLDSLALHRPKKWDKKWRVLIFDIPTTLSYNRARDALRSKIKELDFYQLQRSVWIHPFPCEEEILFVAENYNVQKYIEILTVEHLLHEDYIKNKFKHLKLT